MPSNDIATNNPNTTQETPPRPSGSSLTSNSSSVDASGGVGVSSPRPLVENDGLIPKPQGEPGRKVRGYNIEEVIQWPETDITNLKVRKSVYGLADLKPIIETCP
jgi:hypothetical protein